MDEQQEKTTLQKLSAPAMTIFVYAGKCLLILCTVYCTLGVIISAFNFEVDMVTIFYAALISTLVITAVSGKFGLKGLGIALAPPIIALIWDFSRISDGFQMAVNYITARYSRWIPIPELFEESTLYLSEELTVFFISLAVALTFLIVLTVCFMNSTVLTVLITLPMVMLSFVLVETPPDAVYLVGLITGYLAMLFADGLYPDDFKKCAAAAIPVFVLAAVFTGCIYLTTPPERYQREGNLSTIREIINNIGDGFFNTLTGLRFRGTVAENSWIRIPNAGAWLFNTNRVNVADARERVITDQSLLEVQISVPGAFYIRGYSMGDFDGREWIALEHETEEDIAYDALALTMPALVTHVYSDRIRPFAQAEVLPDHIAPPPLPPVDLSGINIRRINDITNVDYKPYYMIAASLQETPTFPSLPEGYEIGFFHVPNTDDLGVIADEANLRRLNVADSVRYSVLERSYTNINVDTAEVLRSIAVDAGIEIDADRETLAKDVAEFILSTGTYTLNPPLVPYDTDFALYFLETTQQGYCIHYATAATLMLRALNVPARFVSGYVTAIAPGQINNVVTLTDANAHAWVEILLDDVGWIPVEVTPGGGPVSLLAQIQNVETPTPQPTIPPVTPPPFEPERDAEDAAEAFRERQEALREEQRENQGIPEWAIDVMIFAASVATPILVIIIRRKVAGVIRKGYFMQKNTNAAVIYMWKYINKVSRGYSEPLGEIEDLALKARFSQHRITEEEREQMLALVGRFAAKTESKMSEFEHFLFRYFRALG